MRADTADRASSRAGCVHRLASEPEEKIQYGDKLTRTKFDHWLALFENC